MNVVGRALVSVKETDIEGAVGALSLDDCDVLMKYIYRGLGSQHKEQTFYTTLLKWHPVVLKKAGQGSIIRAISEVGRQI